MAKTRYKRRIPPPSVTPETTKDIPTLKSIDPSAYRNKLFQISFEYVQVGHYCLSKCDRGQIKTFLKSLKKAHQRTWGLLYDTGGKPHGGKVGLGYTPYKDNDLRSISRPPELPQDAQIGSLRANDKMRIIGAKIEDTFFVLWFDKDHKLIR